MAVSVSDLLEPRGDLDPAVLWPKKSATKYEALVRGYLAQAQAKAAGLTVAVAPMTLVQTKDEAAKQWVYYRAYRAAYLFMVRRPSTVAVRDEGSKSTLVTQIQLMKDLMDEAKAAFDAIAEAEEPEEDMVVVPPRSSASVTAHFAW